MDDGFPPAIEAVFSKLAERPYPDEACIAAGLAGRFRDAVVDATSAAWQALEREDPTRGLHDELGELAAADGAGIADALRRVSAVVGDGAKLGYFVGELENRLVESGSGRKPDRRAVIDRAIETAQAAIESYRQEFSIRFIEKEYDEYLSELDSTYAAIRLLHARLSVFSNWFGRLWDLSSGRWQVSDWACLADYAQRLEKCPELQALVDSLGRMAEAERELRIEITSACATKPEWAPGAIGKSEINGIRFSDDLPRMLPSEAALLSSPETELLFLKKYAEKSLLTLEYSGEELFEKPEPQCVQERSEARRRGPFIVCVDTSGSMHGAPETIAKTLAFAVLKRALEQSRPCLLVSFSTEISVFDLTAAGKGLDELIGFLGMSFHGGTDAAAPLSYCVARLAEDAWKNADILVVSDLVAPKPPDEVCRSIQVAREKGSRFEALVIGNNAHSALGELFDAYWQYEPERGVHKALARIVESL